MNITSFEFYIMTAIAMVVYYILPLNKRWIVLFISSIYFIVRANGYVLAAITVAIAVWAYVATLFISKHRNNEKMAKAIISVGVLGMVICLLSFKEQAFFVNTSNIILNVASVQTRLSIYEFMAPLGISYFSLTLISYVCEVYWGTVEVQKNPLKLMTYGLYFPTLTSGPILKYNEHSKNILNGHRFEYKNLCFGTQRIVWGFFKKLVISERVAIVVNTIYSDAETYKGLYVPMAAALFALQLYTDFSGCIDIILGVSELFGITLPENFDKPFISKSLSEFWRRWHITLGGWLKEYVLYPILKSELFQKIGEKSKGKFGKKIGKKIPTWIGLLISWFLIGFWHGGGYNYIFGVGLFMGVVIILGEIFEPSFVKLKKTLQIDDKKFSWELFQMIRTFCIFSFGLSFFRAESLSQGFSMWKSVIRNPGLGNLFDGSLSDLGLSMYDFGVLQVSVLFMAVAGLVSLNKKASIRELVAEQGVIFRWLFWLGLVLSVVVFGKYGSGYNANNFIYVGF